MAWVNPNGPNADIPPGYVFRNGQPYVMLGGYTASGAQGLGHGPLPTITPAQWIQQLGPYGAGLTPESIGAIQDDRGIWLVPAELHDSRVAPLVQQMRESNEAGDPLATWGPAAAAAFLTAIGPLGLAAAGSAGTAEAGATASLPESYWSTLAEAGGTLSDVGPAAAGTVGGAGEGGLGLSGAGTAGAFDAAGVGTGVDAGVMASNAGLGQGVTGTVFPSVAGPTVGSSGNILTRLASSAGNVLSGEGSRDDWSTLGTAATVGGGAVALGGALTGGGGLGGRTTQTSSSSLPPMSDEERELIRLNAELTKRQLSAIDQLQPFQKQILEQALATLQRQSAEDAAVAGAVTPEERTAQARSEFERTQRLGPIQDEMLQIQLDTLRRGGAASPEQKAQIATATDAAIQAGYGDIDVATERGIGLISDELANARGLRLTDTPILREATLLNRSAADQKVGLTRSLRANQANAELNYPLGVAQLTSQIGAQQQNIAQSAKQFQEELRQRAFQNRLALTGQASATGLGLASAGGGNAALSALTNQRLNSGTTTTNVNRGIGLSDIGNLGMGIAGVGRLMFS